jgi:predicted RNase H-like HicB family nuclease
MKVELDLEEDGRWIAEIPDLPGVIAYGKSQEDAIQKSEGYFRHQL